MTARNQSWSCWGERLWIPEGYGDTRLQVGAGEEAGTGREMSKAIRLGSGWHGVGGKGSSEARRYFYVMPRASGCCISLAVIRLVSIHGHSPIGQPWGKTRYYSRVFCM